MGDNVGNNLDITERKVFDNLKVIDIYFLFGIINLIDSLGAVVLIFVEFLFLKLVILFCGLEELAAVNSILQIIAKQENDSFVLIVSVGISVHFFFDFLLFIKNFSDTLISDSVKWVAGFLDTTLIEPH